MSVGEVPAERVHIVAASQPCPKIESTAGRTASRIAGPALGILGAGALPSFGCCELRQQAFVAAFEFTGFVAGQDVVAPLAVGSAAEDGVVWRPKV